MYIYLDQNKWIDLAKFNVGKKDGEKFKDVSEKIIKKVSSKEWILPISTTHTMETLPIHKKERLENLLNTFNKYSNTYMCSYQQIEKDELLNSIASTIGGNEINVSKKIFSDDIYKCFDSSIPEVQIPKNKYLENHQKIKTLAQNFIDENHNSSDFFKKLILSSSKTENDKEYWSDAAEEMKSFRDNLFSSIKDDTKRLNRIINDRFGILIGTYFNVIDTYLRTFYLKNKNIDMTKNLKMLSDKIVTDPNYLPLKMPSLDVRSKLTFQLFKEKEKFHRNDIKDISFLSTALHYCDIVITEKQWINYAERHKLDEMYNVKLYSDLNELLNC